MLDVSGTKFGVRNRGEYKDIKTSGMEVTTFFPFEERSKYLKASKSDSFIGIDSQGKIKAGNIDDFDDTYKVSKTFSNEITGFKKSKDGKIVLKQAPSKASKIYKVPVFNTVDGKEGSLNAFASLKNGGTNEYGKVVGGRVLIQTPDKKSQYLIAGSIDDLDKSINTIKKKHGVNSVVVYSLDAGTYLPGLRKKNNNISASDWKKYDAKNQTGGSGLYLLPQSNIQYDEEYQTPNIRTSQSESYKKGHSLENKATGIVLHHTGFSPDDMGKGTHKLFMKSGGNSAHVVITKDGKLKKYADPSAVTFHAGESRFNNTDNVNDFMLGVEFDGDTNKTPLTDAQINTYIRYIDGLKKDGYDIPLTNMVTHELVRDSYNSSRNRKEDHALHKPDISVAEYNRLMEALNNHYKTKK